MKIITTNRFDTLPKDIKDLIWEYAADKSKKIMFLKTYLRMHYIWISFACEKRRKYVKLLNHNTSDDNLLVDIKGFAGDEPESLRQISFSNVNADVFFDTDVTLKDSRYVYNFTILI